MGLYINKRWNQEMIANHIISKEGKEPLNYTYYLNEYPDVHAAAIRFFGSWKFAIEACGLDYSDIRKYKKWSKQKILDEIKNREKNGNDLSSNKVQDDDNPLYMAALKKFKNWGTAVSACGIDYKKVRLRRLMTPLEVEGEIIELFNSKENLSYSNIRIKYQYLLAAGMKKLGDGSWVKARNKCGIDINYRLPINHMKKLK